MRLWRLGLAGALLLSVAAAATEQEVTQAVEALEEAYRDGDEILITEAIEGARGIADPKVVALVGKGLRARQRAVREAAILALGVTLHPDALGALHNAYWNDKGLREDDALFTLLLREIGRHGDPTSVKVLADSPFDALTYGSGSARILGLGNIRTNESVETLIGFTKLGGGRGRRGVDPSKQGRFTEVFRAAMIVLTGQDHGISKDEWGRWWNDNRGSFQVAPERPQVPEDVQGLWERYWGTPYYREGKAPAPAAQRAPFEPILKPTKEQVTEAAEAIREAYATKDTDRIIEAIKINGAVCDPAVVYEVARGIRSPQMSVRLVAVSTLGWMSCPEALKQLHRLYRTETGLSKEEALFAETLKAIGRHRSPKSIDVLASDPFKNLTLASGRARIYGLGNIRDIRSVETLIQGMRLAGNSPNRSRRGGAAPRFVDAFRVALAVLTGADAGESKEAWEAWWRENKKTFRMSKERPAIAPEIREKWEAYWEEPY